MVKDYYIKNRVCDRCIKVLEDEPGQTGMRLLEIELGRLRLNVADTTQENTLETLLKKNGFDLITSTAKRLTQQVKTELIEKGGYWLSNVDEIKNPYYGEKMLKYGKFTEKIEK